MRKREVSRVFIRPTTYELNGEHNLQLASMAQWLGYRTLDPRVMGSIPGIGNFFLPELLENFFLLNANKSEMER